LQQKGYNDGISANVNAMANKFKFNGKENNPELGLNWLDFGARNYDASLGRWMGLDPLADDYYNISPYAYTANNPVYFIDPDGKQIEVSYAYQQDQDGNDVLDDDGNKILIGINITITGKLINFSDEDVDLVQALNDITSSIEEAFSGKYGDLPVTTTANLSIAESFEDLEDSDHLFVLAEPGENNGGLFTGNRTIAGAVNGFGGKVTFLRADFFTGWYDTNFGKTGQVSAAHELGHLFNLRHTRTGLMRSGNSVGGGLSSSQFGSIIKDYEDGNLNLGTNYDARGFPNKGVLLGSRLFTLTNTNGRNKKDTNSSILKQLGF